MKQSIVPVVSWKEGANYMKCIGTAFIVSCTGFVVTAAHVVLDPSESGDARIVSENNEIRMLDDVTFGVTIPFSPASGRHGFSLIPIEKAWYWGAWQQSPLMHEPERFDSKIDIAICKLPELPGVGAYQPLHLSLNSFSVGEDAYAIGYGDMQDVPISYVNGEMRLAKFEPTLYVSIGEIMNVFPRNAVQREVPTPGPCFDFKARIPGRMSGAPIFGAQGAVVRGVVSRSFTDEQHAYGCMMGPAMALPLSDGVSGSGFSLEYLMKNGNEGIALIQGQGM
jgi:hypothetical protein